MIDIDAGPFGSAFSADVSVIPQVRRAASMRLRKARKATARGAGATCAFLVCLCAPVGLTAQPAGAPSDLPAPAAQSQTAPQSPEQQPHTAILPPDGGATGSVSGSAVDTDAAAVGGAQVALQDAESNTTRTT